MVSAEALVDIDVGAATRKPAARSAVMVLARNLGKSFMVECFLLGKSPAHAKTLKEAIKAVSEKSNELAQCLRQGSRIWICPLWLAVDNK